jgi:hypothetical protein
MSSLSVGVLSGLIFGVVAVLSMLPLRFPDKPAALSAAFLNRLGIGVAIGAAQIAWPGWAVGLMFGSAGCSLVWRSATGASHALRRNPRTRSTPP